MPILKRSRGPPVRGGAQPHVPIGIGYNPNGYVCMHTRIYIYVVNKLLDAPVLSTVAATVATLM